MTARAVPEWIGRRPESMPGDTVRLRIGERQSNKCACGCGHVFNYSVDQIDCDHIVPLKDEGENRESNLQLLLHECHVPKTRTENIARGIERRHKAKAFKHQARPGFATNRNGEFKKKMDGTIVRRRSTVPQNAEHEDQGR